jgi:hypothetical protein
VKKLFTSVPQTLTKNLSFSVAILERLLIVFKVLTDKIKPVPRTMHLPSNASPRYFLSITICCWRGNQVRGFRGIKWAVRVAKAELLMVKRMAVGAAVVSVQTSRLILAAILYIISM